MHERQQRKLCSRLGLTEIFYGQYFKKSSHIQIIMRIAKYHLALFLHLYILLVPIIMLVNSEGPHLTLKMHRPF